LGAAGAGGGGGGGAVINSEEFQANQEKFAAQHVELYMRSRAGELAFNQEKANSIAL
jgi:fatty acid synthase subunit beta